MTISGHITDADSGKPLVGAVFQVVNNNDYSDVLASATTDSNGYYSLTSSLLDNEDADISITKDGYGQMVGPAAFFYGTGNGDIQLYSTAETGTTPTGTSTTTTPKPLTPANRPNRKPNYTLPIALGATALVSLIAWLMIK